MWEDEQGGITLSRICPQPCGSSLWTQSEMASFSHVPSALLLMCVLPLPPVPGLPSSHPVLRAEQEGAP